MKLTPQEARATVLLLLALLAGAAVRDYRLRHASEAVAHSAPRGPRPPLQPAGRMDPMASHAP